MKEKVWVEYHSSAVVAVAALWVGAGVIWHWGWSYFYGSFNAMPFVIFWYLLVLQLLGWRARINTGNLAVVDRQGKIVEIGCSIVRRSAFPFRTRYRIVRYPASMKFYSPFNPITKNPKMVPLAITVIVRPCDRSSPNLYRYINMTNEERERIAETYRGRVFDLVQNDFPQDLARVLNPYRPGTFVVLQSFLAQHLDSFLQEYGHEIGEVRVSVRN
ncbi:MAG: hypothetical protein HYT98_02480 [Candidatus Sungbacteria bacterium]|nr:hypothetical protein [Candidatus Sungbacteria bacterium]